MNVRRPRVNLIHGVLHGLKASADWLKPRFDNPPEGGSMIRPLITPGANARATEKLFSNKLALVKRFAYFTR